MKPKFNWAGSSLNRQKKLREARTEAKKRKKKVYNAERYADPIYREAILEKQRTKRRVDGGAE
jgi:hypothetical protein